METLGPLELLRAKLCPTQRHQSGWGERGSPTVITTLILHHDAGTAVYAITMLTSRRTERDMVEGRGGGELGGGVTITTIFRNHNFF